MAHMTGPSAPAATNAPEAIEALGEARERTLALVAPVSDEDLERVHSTLMSPLVWDLGHIAAFEDLWLVHRYGREPMLRADLVDVYDAMETPRARRGDLPFLRTAEARAYLELVRARTLELIDERGIGDGVLHELVLRHEQQHNETMLQTLQLARLADWEPPEHQPVPDGPDGHPTGLELLDVPAWRVHDRSAGRTRAHDPGLDKLRLRQRALPPPNRRARASRSPVTPITNATYLHFVEGGGYERREWWSDEGWAWKEQYDITRPGCWTADHAGEWRLGKLEPLHPRRPVVHVSWFEADAFARSHGVRLPTEVEWEKAATWDQEQGAARPYPWGNDPPIPGVHANVDQLACGPAPAGAYPAGASPVGCLGMVGDVWEWTADEFDRLPGVPGPPLSRVLRAVLRRRLQGAARRLVGDASPGRDADVPQLGLPPAPTDLLRDQGGAVRQVLDTDAITIHSCVSDAEERVLADDVLDGLTKPFKELPPKHFYDARGSELFERDLRAARVLPDPNRAPDPRAERGGDRRGDRGRGARRAWIGLGREGADPAGRDGAGWHAAPVRAARRFRERARERRAGAGRRIRRAPGRRRDRRLRATPGQRPGRRRAADRRAARRHDRELPARDAASAAEGDREAARAR